MTPTTIICPGCEEPLHVPLEDGYAYGACQHCGETIEVNNGIVYDGYTADAAEASGLQCGIFQVDVDAAFEGWHRPDQRRGPWALPLFSKAEADRLAAYISRDGYSLEYDAGGDRYVYRAPHAEPACYYPVECHGERLYAIGHDSWSWQER